MNKKEYLKPAQTVFATSLEQQMLVESVLTVTTTGLDDTADLHLPDEEDPTTGVPWIDAF